LSKGQAQSPLAIGGEDSTLSAAAAFGIALLAALLAFLPSLFGSFIFDDFGLPFAKPEAATMSAHFWIGGVRPVLMASYWLNFVLSDQNPVPYHLFNLFLHALTATFVYFCGLSLLKAAGIAEPQKRTLAIFIAGIFLLHPLQTESVDYIAGRSEVLTGVFYFGAFAVFLQALHSSFGFGRVLAVLALFGAAALSKEHAVTLPVLMLLTGVWWSDSGLQHIRRGARLYLSVLALAAAAATYALYILAGAKSAGFGMTQPRWYEYFLTECRVIPVYLRLFIAPAGQNADWSLPFSHGWFDPWSAFCLLALCTAVAFAVRCRRRAPLIGYGFIVFLLLLAPTSSVMPIKDALAERRMYLPVFGLAVAAAGLLASLKLTARNLTGLVIAVLAVAGVLSFRRSEVWTSEVALWSDVVDKSPENIRGYTALGAARVKAKQCGEAIAAYQAAIRLGKDQTGDQPNLDMPLASAYVCNHEPAKAREMLRKIASPEAAKMLDGLGVASGKEGDGQQALSDFNDAIRIAPDYALAYLHRGMYEYATSDERAAEEDLRHTLVLDPGNVLARDGLQHLRHER